MPIANQQSSQAQGQAVNPAILRLVQPGAGQNAVFDVVPGARIELAFLPVTGSMAKVGDDLVFNLDGDATITLRGYYVAAGSESPAQPVFVGEDGTELDTQAFLTAMGGEDLLPAAGPDGGQAATPPGSGGGEYDDGSGAMTDGVNRLGTLGTILWDRATETPEAQFGGEAFTAGTDTPPLFVSSVVATNDYNVIQEYYSEADGSRQVPVAGGNVLVNDYDPEGDDFFVVGVNGQNLSGGSITITDPDGWGTLVLNADGSYTFTANGERSNNLFAGDDLKDGQVTFRYQIQDVNGAVSEAELVIDIVPNRYRLGESTDDAVDGGKGADVLVGDPGGVDATVKEDYSDLNIAIVVDKSGSMGEDGIFNAREAVKNACQSLVDFEDMHGMNIEFTIVGFSTSAVRIPSNIPLSDGNGNISQELSDWIDANFNALGDTNYEAAFMSAKQWFSTANPDGKNLMLFVSDGEPTSYYVDAFVAVKNGSTESVTCTLPSDYAYGNWVFFDAQGNVIAQYEKEYFATPMDALIGRPAGTEYCVASSGTFCDKNFNNHKMSVTALVADDKGNETSFPDHKNVRNGDYWHMYETEDFESQDAFNSLLNSVNGLTVKAIGIGSMDVDYLGNYDTSGTAASAMTPADLDDLLQNLLKGQIFDFASRPAGADTLNGGDGSDALFGDALNADWLLLQNDWTPSSALNAGDSIKIIAEYLAQTRHPGEANPQISAEEFHNFILANSFLFGLSDTVLDASGNPRGNADYLYGGAGDDVLFGQGGNDFLFGGDGNDVLDGGLGIDYLNGGSGADAFIFRPDGGNDVIDGFNAAEGDFIVRIGTEQDYSSSALSFINGSAGNSDYHYVHGIIQGNNVHVADGNSYLISGTGASDTLVGGVGNDVIFGGSGNDLIYGGAGNDIIFGGSGNDTIHGGIGNDVMWGGSGHDVFAWNGDLGGLDKIMDFDLAEDKLSFSDLFGADQPSAGSIEHLLNSGQMSMHAIDSTHFSLIIDAASGTQTVDVTLSSGSQLNFNIDMDSFNNSYVEQTLLLQQILTNVGG